MAKKAFGTVVRGSNVEGKGAKKGRSGLDPRFNTDIGDDVFSSEWNTPLNMKNVDDPLIDPDEGAIIQEGAKALGLPPNPLGIANIEEMTVRPGGTSSVGRNRSGRGR